MVSIYNFLKKVGFGGPKVHLRPIEPRLDAGTSTETLLLCWELLLLSLVSGLVIFDASELLTGD